MWNIVSCNSEPKQYYFQNSGTDLGLEIYYLNDKIQFYLIFTLISITWFYIYILTTFIIRNVEIRLSNIPLIDLNHGSNIEIIWTIIPTIVLIIIAISGFKVIYMLDIVNNSDITVKCIGSQWYWTYQINDYIFNKEISVSYESYMLSNEDLNKGQLRLMEVDNELILPINKLIKIITTSTDVIHSFSIPSLSIKIDTIPGRLNQTSLIINKTGIYYGACQELCGIQHSFMPIKIKATNFDEYITNILNKIS